MSHLGTVKYFLSMEISQNNICIFFFQSKYATNVLKKFKLDCYKKISTPLIVNEKEDGEKLEDPTVYRSVIGSLLYLTKTRSDLMFSTRLLSRYMTSPSKKYDLMFT